MVSMEKKQSTKDVMDENGTIRQYRGKCKYKSGRCPNERTLKYNGDIHTLCEEHRLRHNQIQCKSDTKIRRFKKTMNAYKKNEPVKRGSVLDDILQSTLTLSAYDSSFSSWKDFGSIEFDQQCTTTREEWTPEDAFIFTHIMGIDFSLDDAPKIETSTI